MKADNNSCLTVSYLPSDKLRWAPRHPQMPHWSKTPFLQSLQHNGFQRGKEQQDGTDKCGAWEEMTSLATNLFLDSLSMGCLKIAAKEPQVVSQDPQSYSSLQLTDLMGLQLI